MKNLIQRYALVLFAVIFAAAVFMTGCSLFDTLDDKGASLTFRVTGEMAAKIAGETRSAHSADNGGSDTDGLFFDIALKGGYSASKTLPVTDGAEVTFDDIPVGTTLYAEGEAYRTEDGEKVILYTGKSEEITVQEGVNTLSLKMQKVKQEEPAAETYTVTFETNGGSEIEAQTVTSGETASEPTAPTLEGYGFAGWYSDSDLTSEFSFDTAITEDTILYAKWGITLASARSEGAVIVCAYNQKQWGDTSTKTITFKCENGAYEKTAGSFSNETLTFNETENTLTLSFTEDVYIDTTVFYLSTSQYEYKRVMDEDSQSASTGATVTFKSISINGVDIMNILTQKS